MKVVCAWCSLIYTPKDRDIASIPREVFCTVGCRDADKLFKMYVLKEFEGLQELRRKRLPGPK